MFARRRLLFGSQGSHRILHNRFRGWGKSHRLSQTQEQIQDGKRGSAQRPAQSAVKAPGFALRARFALFDLLQITKTMVY
jgi:hypothetical protein